MIYIKKFPQSEYNNFFLTNYDNENSFINCKPNGIELTKLIDEIGLEAQGNFNPPSRFSKLSVVDYFGTIHDLSYSVSASSVIADWESKVIDGYGIIIFNVPLRDDVAVPPGVVNYNLNYIHKKEISSQQTSVTP